MQVLAMRKKETRCQPGFHFINLPTMTAKERGENPVLFFPSVDLLCKFSGFNTYITCHYECPAPNNMERESNRHAGPSFFLVATRE